MWQNASERRTVAVLAHRVWSLLRRPLPKRVRSVTRFSQCGHTCRFFHFANRSRSRCFFSSPESSPSSSSLLSHRFCCYACLSILLLAFCVLKMDFGCVVCVAVGDAHRVRDCGHAASSLINGCTSSSAACTNVISVLRSLSQGRRHYSTGFPRQCSAGMHIVDKKLLGSCVRCRRAAKCSIESSGSGKRMTKRRQFFSSMVCRMSTSRQRQLAERTNSVSHPICSAGGWRGPRRHDKREHLACCGDGTPQTHCHAHQGHVKSVRECESVIQDYCGAVGEEAIRKNFILIYELIDEILDYGFPQITSTDELKSFILSQPTPVTPTVVRTIQPLHRCHHCCLGQSVKGNVSFGLQKGATGLFKSVLETDRTDGKRREEIFIDVIEKMVCVFSSTGFMQTGQIDGAIQVTRSRTLTHTSHQITLGI